MSGNESGRPPAKDEPPAPTHATQRSTRRCQLRRALAHLGDDAERLARELAHRGVVVGSALVSP